MTTCLVVDDANFDRALIANILVKLGMTVQEAANAQEAIDICSKSMPECIFIDWEMPGVKGIDLLEELRKMESSKNTCMIMYTSNDHSSFIGRAYIKGANQYVKKPVTKESIEEILREVNLLSS